MKYINPYYPWFTSIGNVKYSGKGDGFIAADGWASVSVNENVGYRVKMAFDVMFVSWNGTTNLAGLEYGLINGDAVDVFLYFNYDECLDIKVGPYNTVCSTGYKLNKNIWCHVMLDVDSTAGIIAIYADGQKIGEYKNYTKKGASLKTFKFYLNSVSFRMKNFIVTDGELSSNEIVMEVPVSVLSSEWTESQGSYSTEAVCKSIVLKPAKTRIDGYTITGAGIIWEEAIGSDNAQALNTVMGQKTGRIQLPSGKSCNAGICFDGVDVLENIVITSAK